MLTKLNHVIKLTGQQLSHNYKCSFCRKAGQKVNAVYRTRYEASHDNGYACDDHKDLLPDNDPDMRKQQYHADRKAKKRIETSRGDHLTEADYQTWYNL